MGLRSPFGYVDYEVPLSRLLIDIMDNLCAHCHTDRDYEKGCRGCPAGCFLYVVRDYILTAEESDKRFELYASDEWTQRANRKPSEEERQKDLNMADDYRPECDILRSMKSKIKRLKPRPFFYIRDRRLTSKGWKRPKVLNDFAELTESFAKKREARLRKWGLSALV